MTDEEVEEMRQYKRSMEVEAAWRTLILTQAGRVVEDKFRGITLKELNESIAWVDAKLEKEFIARYGPD